MSSTFLKSALAACGAFALSQATSATEISVAFSEDFAEDLAETYGEREGEILTEDIVKDLTRALEKANVAPARIDVTIQDAQPNRPTFGQLREQPGLDMFRSISIGGMDLSGIAYDETGAVLAELQYDWFETDITQVAPAGTWSDANRASERFAKKLAKEIGDS